jgi:hypothetical protein
MTKPPQPESTSITPPVGSQTQVPGSVLLFNHQKFPQGSVAKVQDKSSSNLEVPKYYKLGWSPPHGDICFLLSELDDWPVVVLTWRLPENYLPSMSSSFEFFEWTSKNARHFFSMNPSKRRSSLGARLFSAHHWARSQRDQLTEDWESKKSENTLIQSYELLLLLRQKVCIYDNIGKTAGKLLFIEFGRLEGIAFGILSNYFLLYGQNNTGTWCRKYTIEDLRYGAVRVELDGVEILGEDLFF